MRQWHRIFYAAYSRTQVVIATTCELAAKVASNPGGYMKKCYSYDEAFDYVTSFMDMDDYEGFGLLTGSKLAFDRIRYRRYYD